MKWKRLRLRWVLLAALVFGGWSALHFMVVGLPATPMTVARADRMFAEGVHPAQSLADVKTWLASRAIPPGPGLFANKVSYGILRRHEDVTFKGWWMDCRGNRTVAECAGLDVDTVYSVIRVTYPDADRFFLGSTEITVYLFFDANERLLRHWVNEFHITL